MMVQRANVYRLDPTPEQAATFSQWVGARRTVLNLALEQRRTWGREHRLSYRQQQAEITPLRARVDWLKAVPVHTLQMAVRAVDQAYQRFFCGFLRGSAAAQDVQGRQLHAARSGLSRLQAPQSQAQGREIAD